MAKVTLSTSPGTLHEDGPRIRISIGHSAVELEQARSIGLEIPEPYEILALIDSGARTSVVNPEVATRCKLQQTGVCSVVAVGSSGVYPEYAAAITFPRTGLRGFPVIRVIGCKIVGQHIACLIGRDILSHWRFHLDGRTGEVTVED